MPKLYRQDFDLQIQTDFGTLHDTNIAITSTSERAIHGKVSKQDVAMGMHRFFANRGVKLVSIGVVERLVVDDLAGEEQGAEANLKQA